MVKNAHSGQAGNSIDLPPTPEATGPAPDGSPQRDVAKKSLENIE